MIVTVLKVCGKYNDRKLEKAEDFKGVFVVYCVLESKKISSSVWIVE